MLAAVAALVVIFTGIPMAASATGPTGSITGHAYYDIDGTEVSPTGGIAFATNLAGGAQYSADLIGGVYDITGLPAGDYVVEMRFATAGECDDCAWSMWAGDTPHRSQAEVVTVGSGVTTVDITSYEGGGISGNIADASDGFLDGLLAEALLKDPGTGEIGSWITSAETDASGDYWLRGLPDGEYLVRFGPAEYTLTGADYWNNTDWIAAAQMVTVSGGAVVESIDGTVGDEYVYIDRYSGADRFAMAVGISEEFDAGVDIVFVVNGLNYPDALSAGPVAARFGGPILLVTPSGIPAVVAAELERLDPETIVVVGGVNSVGTAVYDQLAGYANEIDRVAGATRFDASLNLVGAAYGGSGAETVYIATGNNFPDALAAGSAASKQNAPMLLVNGHSTAVDAATAEVLEGLGTSRIVVVGGPASVTPAFVASLSAVSGVSEVVRRSGADRFEAAAGVNRAAFPAADTVFLATGMNFPDALAGGPLAGAWQAPIYLVQRDCVPWSVLDEIVRLQPREIKVLGGPNSVSDLVMDFTPCGTV